MNATDDADAANATDTMNTTDMASATNTTGTVPPTSTVRRWRSSRVWRELAPFASLVPALVVYGILRIVFTRLMGSHGLVTPSGPPGMGLVVFGVVMLVMRLALLVGVPLIVTYRLVRRLLELAGLRPK